MTKAEKVGEVLVRREKHITREEISPTLQEGGREHRGVCCRVCFAMELLDQARTGCHAAVKVTGGDRWSAAFYGEVVPRKDVRATFPGASFGTDQGVDCEPAEGEVERNC